MNPDASGRNTIGGILEDLEAEGLVEKVGHRVKPGVSGRPPVVWAWIGDRK
jgi:predicted ArsR family transcriptional regulator